MRSGWTIALVLLSACNRPNPGFESGDETSVGDDDAGTTVGSGATTQGTTGGESSVDGGSETSAGDTTVGVSGTDSGSSEGSETGPACTPSFDPPYGIVAEPSFATLFGECSASETLYVSAGMRSDDDTVVGTLCNEMCSCAGGGPITLSFDVPLPPLSDCFRLDILFHAMSCEVAAYMLVNDGIPGTVVSNVSNPALPLSFGLADDPTMICGEGCMPPSGKYAVVSSFDGTEVPPDDNAVPYLGGDYSVFNHGSGIDGDCREQVRWYLLPAGG